MRIAIAILLTLLPTAALTQTHQPYAGMDQRSVKALSPRMSTTVLGVRHPSPKGGREMGAARR